MITFLKKWFTGVVLKRMVYSGAKWVVTFAASHGISLVASWHGYTVNLEDQAAMAAFIATALKFAEHHLALAYPQLAWLDGLGPQDIVVVPGSAPAVDPGPIIPSVIVEEQPHGQD